MNKLPKIMLLDANALIHRSYHALPPLTSPKGEMVNAVYGFSNALLKAIKDERPDYVVACFDSGRHTFRNDLFDGYKAHRKETDEALYLQIPRVKQIVEVLNIPLLAQSGVEADDLIGSLSKKSVEQGMRAVIVTGDNDALQLVNGQVAVYSLRRGVTDTLNFDREAVKEKLGIYPEQVVDYKALAGDSSDNIPGAPGVGPKTAADLLNRYKDLEGIYQNLGEVKERIAEILRTHKDQVILSRQLAEIKCDLDIELNLEEAAVENFNFHAVVNLFKELGFKSLLTKLPTPKLEQEALLPTSQDDLASTTDPLPYEAVTSISRVQEVVHILEGKRVIAVDTETTDIGGEIIGISLAWDGESAVYLPTSPGYKDGLPLGEVRRLLQPVLSNSEITKIGHNLKYDLAVLDRAGIEVKGDLFDTMIASQLVNSQLFTHNIDDISLSELGFKKISITTLIGPKKKESMASAPLDKLSAYACEDVLIAWRLYEHFKKDLEEVSLKKIFYEVEMPLLPVLHRMENRGIKIDVNYLNRLGSELKKQLEALEQEIHNQAGTSFNIASPLQLQRVLFQDLKLPVKGIKKTKNGYSTDAESLQKLYGEHSIVGLLSNYRELAKLLSTYIETLPLQADERGRVHTSFQQIGAATGRLSSTEPNLQNIPIRTELGNKVRRSFIADEGMLLLGADYSQAELRVLAHLSGDPKLIEAFHGQSDFHAAVAKELGVDRRAAKAINFGIIYGLGSSALANDLGISSSEARGFIDRYFARFPGVSRFIEDKKREAREQGYVSSIFGRKRYLPDIHSPNPMLRSAAERMAVNMPCQGTVADMMKLAMIQVDQQLGEGAQLLLQIHDELLLEVEKSKVEEVAGLLKEVMSSVIELKVPLVVEIKAGSSWADLEKIDS